MSLHQFLLQIKLFKPCRHRTVSGPCQETRRMVCSSDLIECYCNISSGELCTWHNPESCLYGQRSGIIHARRLTGNSRAFCEHQPAPMPLRTWDAQAVNAEMRKSCLDTHSTTQRVVAKCGSTAASHRSLLSTRLPTKTRFMSAGCEDMLSSH